MNTKHQKDWIVPLALAIVLIGSSVYNYVVDQNTRTRAHQISSEVRRDVRINREAGERIGREVHEMHGEIERLLKHHMIEEHK